MVWGDSLLATEADVDSDRCQKSAQLEVGVSFPIEPKGQ